MKRLFIALKIFLFFTILTGIMYPILITGIAQIVFPEKANGSLIIKNNRKVGSELIGQKFDSVIYFCSRPSACDYNTMPSGASNYALTSARLKAQVEKRKHQFLTFNGLDTVTVVPSEMIFASASGLDPHISPEAAILQVNRIVHARGFTAFQEKKLIKLIEDQTEGPQWGIWGGKRVNVLLLNMKLDQMDINKP